jgi:hypothetical protein
VQLAIGAGCAIAGVVLLERRAREMAERQPRSDAAIPQPG